MFILLIIFQCGLILLSTILGVLDLRKQQRERSAIAKIEARKKKKVFIIIAVFGIATQIVIGIDNNYSNAYLNKRLDTLNFKNDILQKKNLALEKAIINEVDSSTATIVRQASINAVRASDNILKSASTLSKIIKGTDSIPSIVIPPSNTLLIYYVNKSDFPIYNMNLKFENVDSLQERCRVDFYGKRFNMNRVCYEKYSTELNVPYVASKQMSVITFPYLSDNTKHGNFAITGRIGNTHFIQQILYARYSNRNFLFAYRNFVLNKKGKFQLTKVYNNSEAIMNWSVFKLPLDFGLAN
ncbi:MAG: hypothetical protein V4619_12080 [Bacteroidota bacterium]